MKNKILSTLAPNSVLIYDAIPYPIKSWNKKKKDPAINGRD